MSGTLAEASTAPEAAVLQRHRKFLAECKLDPVFQPIHEAGIRRFEVLKFPHKKHEMYTFANMHELAVTPFVIAKEGPVDVQWIREQVYPSCQSSYMVIVDGVYRENLSDISALGSQVEVQPLSEALLDGTLRDYLLDTLENENDVFAALNSAFLSHGLCVDVVERACPKTPLQILYVSTGSNAPVTSHPRLIVRMGISAELKLIVKFTGSGENFFINAVQDFIVNENAGLTFTQVQKDPVSSWHCSKTRVQQYRNSRFIASNASSGNRLARHHYEIHLREEGGELQLNGASVLVGAEQVHNFVRIHHEAPHCVSRQHFKNVIDGQGRASVDGTVIVNRGAQLTCSDQLINHLMLSDDAHAGSKPNLMIFADDVKCTHGATVGQIDEEQLFYLKTRGLSQETARALLTTSFIKSILQTISFPDVIAEMNQVLLKKLEVSHG